MLSKKETPAHGKCLLFFLLLSFFFHGEKICSRFIALLPALLVYTAKRVTGGSAAGAKPTLF